MSKAGRMTEKEKRARAAVRKELRAEGVLPPTKKPLNRKRFCEEAEALLTDMNFIVDGPYIVWAIMEMLGHTGGMGTGRSPEAVGAAKVVKLAVARREFEKERREKGDGQFTLGELIEVTGDIYKA